MQLSPSVITEEQFVGLTKILRNTDLYQESAELQTIFTALESLGVKEYVQFDPKIVRGLDYYTGVVFEARDIGKSTRAILGGGRYDDLVKDVGGEPLTGVGFAMGDVVLPIILEQYGLLPDLPVNPTQILVTIFDEKLMPVSLTTAANLRRVGFSVQVYPEPAKIGKQLKFADRSGVKFALVIGPEEKEQEIVQVKDLRTRAQSSVPMDGLINYFKGALAE